MARGANWDGDGVGAGGGWVEEGGPSGRGALPSSSSSSTSNADVITPFSRTPTVAWSDDVSKEGVMTSATEITRVVENG